MKIIYRIILSFVVLASISESSKAALVDLPKFGFTMDILDGAVGSDKSAQALISFLPTQDNFAPNVNVVIQPYTGTIKDYISLSKSQFEQMKVAVISEKTVAENEWICEYSGLMKQSALHWYARAILRSGKIYLVTGTGLESSWKMIADPLKKSVDSFQLK